MRVKSTYLSAGVLVAASMLAVPAAAGANTFHGVVVHENTRAHSFVVAGGTGKLTAIHAARLPRVGHHVTVRATRLRNGTWLAQGIHAGSSAKRVRLRGIVTYVNARRHEFVLSARGASMLVHGLSGRRHGIRMAGDSGLRVGDVVSVDGVVDGDSLDASSVQNDGADANGIDLEGTVEAIDPVARTLTISADDSDQSGATVTVEVPASFDLSLFALGQSVEVIVSPNPDGTYTLEQSSDDSGSHHADNSGEMQGDGHGDQHASAEQQCRAEQADPAFPTTHNGASFTQFYSRDPNNPNDAFGHCVDIKASASGGSDPSGGSDGSGGSGGDSGGSDGSGGSGGSGD